MDCCIEFRQRYCTELSGHMIKLISDIIARKQTVKQVRKNAMNSIQIGAKTNVQDQFRNPSNLNVGNVK